MTFDADMTQAVLSGLQAGTVKTWYDASIIEQLRSTGTPATIFLTGLWTQWYRDVVGSLAADPPFELESHSVDHAAWQRPCFKLAYVSSASAKRREIRDAAATIRSVTGASPRYFRFPGGCHDTADLKLVPSEGEKPVGWDVASGDAFQPNPAVVVATVLRQTRPGSIIVLHLIGAPNARRPRHAGRAGGLNVVGRAPARGERPAQRARVERLGWDALVAGCRHRCSSSRRPAG